MSKNLSQFFDFSLDALAFKEKLARQLMQEKTACMVPLEDDDLEFLHAAGVPNPAPADEDSL